MTIQRMDHVGVVVEDLAEAIAFFVELGLELQGEASVEGDVVDRINGLEGVKVDVAFVQTPDGHSQLELIQFHSPAASPGDPAAPTTALGIRHLTFAVDDVDEVLARLLARGAELVGTVENYEDIYRLCFVRGPAGIILELAQKLG
ncbi:MAG: VOC family protein [Solirubrobacteraceae bacterium]|nr:VOC family protein [Solirubrobacteraceae bacterium]